MTEPGRRALPVLMTIIGFLIWAAGGTYSREPLWQSYLLSYVICLQVALGALGYLHVYELTGGDWGDKLSPVLLRLSGTLKGLAVLSIPVLLELKMIFPWAALPHPDSHFRGIYLTPGLFCLRTILFFSLFVYMRAGVGKTRLPARWGSVGLLVWFLAGSFFAFDWIMSLEPQWYSTVFGLIFLVASALAGLSVAVILTLRSGVLVPDAGNLLLSNLMTWAYLTFSQYLIIWSGNLPDEVAWYSHRVVGGWHVLTYLLAALGLFLPLFLLLFRPVKRSKSGGLAIAAALLISVGVQAVWLILPAIRMGPMKFYVSDLGALLLMAGLFSLLYQYQDKEVIRTLALSLRLHNREDRDENVVSTLPG